MAKQETGKTRSRSSSELIHCENCGEYYAATYRSCPFCEERPTRGRGGRTTNRRGGGYGSALSPGQIISYAASLLLIIAAVAIVVSMLRSLLGRGEEARHPDSSVPPSHAVDTTPPTSSLPPETAPPTSAPVVEGPTAISLNKSDITLTAPNETAQLTATVAPADYSGDLVWTSDNPGQVYVTQTGLVYAVSPGTVTITVTAGNVSASCIVRNKTTGTPPADAGGQASGTTPPADPAVTTQPSASPEPSAPTVSPVSLNKSDFTIRPQDPSTYQLKVSGGDGQNYTWVSDNTSVATVSESGLVTKVGSGRCNITVTSGGQSASCIVRVE